MNDKRTSHFIQTPIQPSCSQPHFDFALEEHTHERAKKVSKDSFTICVITDTQYFCYGEHEPGKPMGELFERQTNWMVRNKDRWNILFVIHVGDCVDKGYEESQWELATKSMRILDNNIPYVVCIGNHDFNDCKSENPVNPSSFLNAFGPQNFCNFSWYKGASDNQLNSYQIVPMNICGRPDNSILILNVEFNFYSLECIPWITNVLNQFNKKLPIIICTHWWVTPPKIKSQPTDTPRTRYQNLILSYDSVFLITCGHKRGATHDIILNHYGNEVIELMRDENDASFPMITVDTSLGAIFTSTYNVLHQLHKTGVAHEWDHQMSGDWKTRFGW